MKDERSDVRARLGPSLAKEWRDDAFFVEALVGLEGVWKVAKHHRLSLTNELFPALNDPGEFRNVTSLGWRWKLLEDPDLSLLATVDNEYQSHVDTGRHNDLEYSTSLGIDF